MLGVQYGRLDSPELDCACFERDSLGNVPIFSPPILLGDGRWRPWRLCGQDEGGTTTTKKDRNSQQMTTIGSPLFVIYFYPGSSPPILTGDKGKRKKRTSDQISRIHPNGLIWEDRRRRLSLPRGYYSTNSFFSRSFVRSTPFSGSWEWIWWFLHHTHTDTHTNVQYKRHTRMVATIWDLIGRNAFTPAPSLPKTFSTEQRGGREIFLLTAFPSFRLPPLQHH